MKRSPWSGSAATGATGETYEIRVIADFLNVPQSRRRICLREFHSWLAIQEDMKQLICAAGDALNTPVPPDALHWRNEVFRWVDDGKATITVRLEEHKQESA